MSKKTVDLNAMLSSADPGARRDIVAGVVDQFVCKVLDYQEEELNYEAHFFDLGLDSVTAVSLRDLINESLNGVAEIEAPDVYSHPSVNKLSEYVEEVWTNNQ